MDINKIYYEIMVGLKSSEKERQKYNDSEYFNYHTNQSNWYFSIANNIKNSIGIHGNSLEEISEQLNSMKNIQLTNEQKKVLSDIRKHPIYKKMMGENALLIKTEIEELLGIIITSKDTPIVSENAIYISVKDEYTLYEELDSNSDKLEQLLLNGQIGQEQYQIYNMALDYIYDYYISESRGEQIPFRKI